MLRRIVSNLIFITLFSQSSADIIVKTLAGSGTADRTDGTGADASFSSPTGITFDSYGVLYVADRGNSMIRKVTSNGVVTSYAGGGLTTVTDSNGNPASFSGINSIVFDASGNLYIADIFANRIKKITPADEFSVFAGNGTASAVDGVGINATFNYPHGLAIDASGNLYSMDWGTNKVRKITLSGVVTTFAGSGATGSTNGVGTNTTFSRPLAGVVDPSGNVYVSDSYNNKIRKITPSGVVRTVAGSGGGFADGNVTTAKFNVPSALAMDASGNIYVADCNNYRIRMITPAGIVTTLAGNGTGGYADGNSSSAMFNSPYGVALDSSGNIYVGDSGNNRIRVINMATITSPTTTTATSTTDAPFYTSSPANSSGTPFTTTLALSIAIPIAVIALIVTAILIYMRINRLDITVVWFHKLPKLVLIDRTERSSTQSKLVR